MVIRQMLIVGLVSCSLSYMGCASDSGLRSEDFTSSKSSKTAPLGDSRYEKLAKELEAGGGKSSAGGDSKSTVSKIGASLKKATSSVTSALTFTPKIVKAADPVSLSTVPEKIDADVYYQAGQLAESKGNQNAAVMQYSKGLKVAPEHMPSLLSLARLHDRGENFAKAERLYRRAIEIDPENATAYNDLGLCLARNDRRSDGIIALRHAVTLNPNRKLYRNNLATVLVSQGEVDEALNQLLAVHPPAAAHYNLGYLLYRKGDREKAGNHLSIASRKDPTLAPAANTLAQVEMAGNDKVYGHEGPASNMRQASSSQTESADGERQDGSGSVAMMVSEPRMRCTPPTERDSSTEEKAPKPPVKLHHPVPANPTTNKPNDKPLLRPLPPQDQAKIQFPRQTRAESRQPQEDNTDLPTPQLLKKDSEAEELPI